MKPILHNFICFAIALFASWLFAGWLSYVWSALFINDRTFTVYWELIAVGTLLNWFFYFIYFCATGLLLAYAIVSKRSWLWCLSLGACYSLLVRVLGSQWFAPDAGVYVYIARYGEYVMPALGGLFGAFLYSLIRTRVLVPK